MGFDEIARGGNIDGIQEKFKDQVLGQFHISSEGGRGPANKTEKTASSETKNYSSLVL